MAGDGSDLIVQHSTWSIGLDSEDGGVRVAIKPTIVKVSWP